MVFNCRTARLLIVIGIFVFFLQTSVQHFIWVIEQLFDKFSHILWDLARKVSRIFLIRRYSARTRVSSTDIYRDVGLLPLSWCLLADFCNHSFIPECGFDEITDVDPHRLFIDECDMFEYNCDNEKDYELVNYTDCFLIGLCPTTKKCTNPTPCATGITAAASNSDTTTSYFPPTRFNVRAGRRMGNNKMNLARNQGRRTLEIGHTLPANMLKGKRRYTPEKTRRPKRRRNPDLATKTTTPRPRAKKRSYTSPMAKYQGPKQTTKTQTVVLKREMVNKWGHKVLKVVKGIVTEKGKPLKTTVEFKESEYYEDSDFIQ